MDYVTISVIFAILVYLIYIKPKSVPQKEKESAIDFSAQNIFDYTLPIRSDSEFDQEDVNNVYDFIRTHIASLALKKPYDLLIYINIRTDKVIDMQINTVGSIEKHLKDLKKVFAKEMFTIISNFPKYYNYHNVYRYYNSKKIYTFKDIGQFYKNKTEKFLLEIDTQNKKLTNQFRSMPFKNKLNYIQKYLHDNGLNRMIQSLRDFDRLGKDEENIRWIVNEISKLDEKKVIEIKHFTSNINFWLVQLEYNKKLPFVPLFLGSFYIKNCKFDRAQHYFRYAINRIPRNFWLYQYCLHLLSFLDVIYELEQNWIEDFELLLQNDEINAAKEILQEYLKFNPYSADINHTLFALENQINSEKWSLKQKQEFLTKYKQKIYQECDPFFIDGLEIPDQKENERFRKVCINPNKCADPLFCFRILQEYNIYLSYALTDFWGQESYNSDMMKTFANFVDKSPAEILEILKEYNALYWDKRNDVNGQKGNNFEIY